MSEVTRKRWMDSEKHGIAWHVHSDVIVAGEDVRLETFSFISRDHAFDKMDKVLHSMGFHGERVRVL